MLEWTISKVMQILNSLIGMSRDQKRAVLLFVDLLLLPLTFVLTLILVEGWHTGIDWSLWPLVVLLTVFASAISSMLGVNRIRLKSFEGSAVGKIGLYSIALALCSFTVAVLGRVDMPTRFHFAFGLMFFLTCSGSRVLMLELLKAAYRHSAPIMTVLIYGAGRTGMQLASALKSQPDIVPVGFVDDNHALNSQIIHGLRVYHGAQLDEALEETKPNRVVIAMPSAPRSNVAKIERRLADKGLEVQVVPSFAQLIGNHDEKEDQLERVAPGTFLGRDHLHEKLGVSLSQYADRNIMVTGAGGSIGSELCRQILACNPKRLVLFELNELALYNIDQELNDLVSDRGIELCPVLGSVMDTAQLRDVISANQVNVILHAAAYKHVPIVEANPLIGLSNNVFGTLNAATCARDAGVERFVLVSSDKAVRPANVMGASKRFAELILHDLASRNSSTVFSMVRFGNVLGSSGSVIPLFQDQVARGGPVTLTDEAVTRYFMTVQEAARLVLTAGSLANGGEVFVLDMGKPIPVRSLAEQVIESAGYSIRSPENPDGDIEIQITGLRPGEKLHEELAISPGHLTTAHEKIFAVREDFLSEIEIARALKLLSSAIESRDVNGALSVIDTFLIREIQPEHAAKP